MTRRTVGGWLVVLGMLSGCPNGGNNGDGGVPDQATADTCIPDGQQVVLASRYAVLARLGVNVKVPSDCMVSCIVDQDTTSSILLLADMTQNGTSVTVSARACRIGIPPVAPPGQTTPTQLTVPDALLASVGAVTATATLGGTTTCAPLISQPLAIVLGARLANPTSDPLPMFSLETVPNIALCDNLAAAPCTTTAATACVCDQEGDASAGATVNASGIPLLDNVDRVYLALRSLFSLNGKVFPPLASQQFSGPRLRGEVIGLALEQSPVGCRYNSGADCDATITNSIVTFNPRVSQATTTTSTFVGVPVSATFTCADAIALPLSSFQ